MSPGMKRALLSKLSHPQCPTTRTAAAGARRAAPTGTAWEAALIAAGQPAVSEHFFLLWSTQSPHSPSHHDHHHPTPPPPPPPPTHDPVWPRTESHSEAASNKHFQKLKIQIQRGHLIESTHTFRQTLHAPAVSAVHFSQMWGVQVQLPVACFWAWWQTGTLPASTAERGPVNPAKIGPLTLVHPSGSGSDWDPGQMLLQGRCALVTCSCVPAQTGPGTSGSHLDCLHATDGGVEPLKCMNIKWTLFFFFLWLFCYQRLRLRSHPPPFPKSHRTIPAPVFSSSERGRLSGESPGKIASISRSFYSHRCRCPVAESAGSQSGPSVCSVLCTSSGRSFGLLFAWPG